VKEGRFIIFALERSGSSSLAAALNQDLSVVQEPFTSRTGDLQSNPKFIELVEQMGINPEQLPDPGNIPFGFNRYLPLAQDKDRCDAYLNHLFDRFVGIKHVWNTVSREANLNILSWCIDQGVDIVFLTRKNLFRSLLSRHLAQQANIFQLGDQLQHRQEWEQAEFEPIDIRKFTRQLESIERDEAYYRRFLKGQRYFFLHYEMLYQGSLKQRQRSFRLLCAFLSINPETLDEENIHKYLFSQRRKQTSAAIGRRLPNYHRLIVYQFYRRFGLQKLYLNLTKKTSPKT